MYIDFRLHGLQIDHLSLTHMLVKKNATLEAFYTLFDRYDADLSGWEDVASLATSRPN